MAMLWAVPSVGRPRSSTRAWLSSTLRRVEATAADDGALLDELSAAPSFFSEHPGIITSSKAYRGKNVSFGEWVIYPLSGTGSLASTGNSCGLSTSWPCRQARLDALMQPSP